MSTTTTIYLYCRKWNEVAEEYSYASEHSLYNVTQLIYAMNMGLTFATKFWNSRTRTYEHGEYLHVVEGDPVYVRTDPNKKLKDNLGKLPICPSE